MAERVSERFLPQERVGAEPGRREDGVDDGASVFGVDAEGVAGLVDEARSFEGQLEVKDFFAGAGAVENNFFEDFRRVGVLLVVNNRGRDGPVQAGRGSDRLGLRKGIQRAREPTIESGLVVDVAVNPVKDPDRPELGETHVEVFPHLAELRVAGVTESTDRIINSGDLGHRVAHEALVVAHRSVRRIAFTPGADHDEEVLDLDEIGGLGVTHIGNGDFKAVFFSGFADHAGKLLTVPRLGSVEHGELALFGRGEERRLTAHGGPGRGNESGKEAREPEGLVTIKPGHERADDLLLLEPQRRI